VAVSYLGIRVGHSWSERTGPPVSVHVSIYIVSACPGVD